MNDIDKILMLQWIGPFFNLEELKQWEIENQTLRCNLYILTGKEFRKRTVSHYVGMTEQEFIYLRLGKNHDHLPKIKKDLSIWVCRFSCPEHATHENISIAETLLISIRQPELNKVKKAYFPNKSICLINQWFKPNCVQLYNRIYPEQSIPDVLVYNSHTGTVLGAERLKKLF